MSQRDILEYILSYEIEPPMKLLDWIDEDELSIYNLNNNPSNGAIEYLSKYYRNYINIPLMVTNPAPLAVNILKHNLEFVYRGQLMKNSNPEIVHIISEHLDTLTPEEWSFLSENPSAIEILKQHLDKVDWRYLSKNPAAIELLKKYPEKIDYRYISSNPNAMDIIMNNLNKIDWKWLNSNPNEKAIELLIAYNKIDWNIISKNPAAINLLEANQDLINYDRLTLNPAIFEPDLKEWKELIKLKADYILRG